jgi:hypothetical protein
MKQARPVPAQHLGIVLDKTPAEAPIENWTGGQNVAFRDGMTYRTGGYERFADPLAHPKPLYALNVIVGPESYWIYCCENKVAVTDGTTHWDLTPAAGLSISEAGDWSGCILNGIPCVNNGSDPPMYWNLSFSSKLQTLPGWPAGATCKALRATKYHLMALNISEGVTNYGSQVWWSKAAAAGALPTEWTPTASNDAGDLVFGDTPGSIVDGLALRDQFIVYKEFSTHVMQYVAGTYVWTGRKLYLTTGVQALNCVVEANGQHWLFTGTDVVRHDGQNYVSVVDEKVKETLVKSIDAGKTKMCCVESRIVNQQVWVCIPEQGNAWLNKAYIVDFVTGDIGIRMLPQVACVCRGIVAGNAGGNSWEVDTKPWNSDITFWDQQSFSPTQDSLLMVDSARAHLYSVDTSDLADGAQVYAFIEKLSAQLGTFDHHKVVTGIIPRIQGTNGDKLSITLGGQPWFNEPIAWGTAQEFVIGTDHLVSDIVEGRLLSVRIEGTTAGVWKFYEYAIKFAEMGEY